MSPATGSTAGGTGVTITGSNFTGASAVTFGTVAATTYSVTNSGSIAATAPMASAGTVDVRVTVNGVTSAVNEPGDEFTYSVPPPPTVTAVSPATGSTAGGTGVTITGSNFTGASAVTFGTVAATTYSVTNSGSIAATAPMASAGTVDVRVTVNGVTSAVNEPGDEFTYKVPTTGTITAVGTLASVEGSGTSTLAVSPKTAGDVLVVFAQTSAAGFTVSSVSGGGVATWTKALSFAGSVGADEEIWYGKVTTTGSATVSFSWSSSITGHVAEYGVEEFSAGLGASTVWATDKTGTLNNASSTTVAMPSLTPAGTGELYFGYSAVAGTAAAGTTSGVTYAVTAEANVAAYDPGVSGALSPAATQSPAGTSSSVGVLLSASTGAPPPPPTVTAVSPATGSTAGGTGVTITGSNFTGASAVTFGTVAATTYSVTNSGSIAATAPMASAGTVDVRVTVNGVTSAVNEPGDEFTYKVPTTGTITAVGTLASVEGSGTSTLAVSPKTAGDVLVVFAQTSAAGFTVSSVSGGGVATWTKALSFAGSVGADEEIWYGKVTTTGSATVSFSWSSSITGHVAEYGVEEFSAGLGASTMWATDKTGTLNNASSTTVAMPSLTPAGTGELYFGYSAVAGTAAAGTTSGVTYAVTAEANVAVYDPGVSGALSPAATQSPAGTSSSVGVLLERVELNDLESDRTATVRCHRGRWPVIELAWRAC